MKKLISVLIVVTLMLTCCLISAGSAFALDSDFIYKAFSDGTAEITGYVGQGGDVEIPSVLGGLDVTTIGDEAFYQNTNIKSITIPDSVYYIGNKAFAGSHIKSVTMPDTIIELGTTTFYQCVYLEDVTLSGGLNVISRHCFDSCSRLESITIPEGISIIDASAFQNCNHLSEVTLPSTTNTIGEYAFAQTAIESINLPESTFEINDMAFFMCQNLSEVIIPAAVKSLGNYSFANCYSLSKVTLNDGLKTIGADTFDHCIFNEITIPKTVENITDYSIGFAFDDSLYEYEQNPNLVINCYKDTAGYEYATKFSFEAVLLDAPEIPTEPSNPTEPSIPPTSEYELGDTNMDGRINVKDATLIQKHVAEIVTLSDEALALADFDGNSKINVRDATAIQKFIAGII